MNSALIDGLPVLARLALAYAPRAAKPATAAFLALDTQLASIARSSTEPMLAQLRYAWWRDALGPGDGPPAHGNAVLEACKSWGRQKCDLVELVNGWEALATDESLVQGATSLSDARARAGAALAKVVGEPHAQDAAAEVTRQWALADLVQNLAPGPDRNELQAVLLASIEWTPRLPRALRALAVLASVARHHVRNRGNKPGYNLVSLLIGIRTGLFGR